ncbi:hypothetical protein [Pseudomonas sp. LP_7_YM]|uniref:hypothetical protein n=1 Tax=Pseudomonas sp. LP_7_YM TaxID=2485137 RepID=UPI0010EC9492|nr:hypothetical protein [Pseudomonas sp. LP_7_YM]TDV62462.1 hypothetical protein EC915_10742 [Pseudomonas sp. LP_7_YM]
MTEHFVPTFYTVTSARFMPFYWNFWPGFPRRVSAIGKPDIRMDDACGCNRL